MPRRWIFLCQVVMFAVAAHCIAWTDDANQPAALDQLAALKQVLFSGTYDNEARSAAAQSLAQIGEGALPILAEALDNPEVSKAASVADAVCHMGKAGPAAVPLLKRVLFGSGYGNYARYEAAQSLAAIGESALPVLIEALSKPEIAQPGAVVYALGCMRAAAIPAVPALIDGARRQPQDGQAGDIVSSALSCIDALGLIAPDDPRVLSLCLDMAAADKRGKNAFTISFPLRASHGDAINMVVNRIKMSEPESRTGFEMVLLHFGKRAVAPVLELASDTNEANRGSALKILSHLDQLYVNINMNELAECEALLDASDSAIREAVLSALEHRDPTVGWLESDAKLLLRLLNDPQPGFGARAGRILGKLRPMNSSTLTGVVAALQSPNESTLRGAALAIQEAGPNAVTAVPALIDAFTREENSPRVSSEGEVLPEESVADTLFSVLIAVGPASPEAIKFLVARLRRWEENIDARGSCRLPEYTDMPMRLIDALTKAGIKSAEATPILRKILKRPETGSALSTPGSGMPLPNEGGKDTMLPGVDADIGIAAAWALWAIDGPDKTLATEVEKRIERSTRYEHAALTQFVATMRTEDDRGQLVKEEIESRSEGRKHYQYYLAFDGGWTKFELAREYVDQREDTVTRDDCGFDPSSLEITWLRKGSLVQAKWTTHSLGSGRYTVDAVLLLEKENGKWRELYRHSGEGMSRGGWMWQSQHTVRFRLAPETGALMPEEREGGDNCSEEKWPLARPTEVSGKQYYCSRQTEIKEWPCESTKGELTVLPGKHWLILADESNYTLEEVAQWCNKSPLDCGGNSSPEEELRRLNPAIAQSGSFTGAILLKEGVAPFEPFGGDLYSTSDQGC